MTIPSTTDDLIAEIEAAAKAAPKGDWIVDENHDEVSVSMGSAIDSPYEYYVHDRWFCESEWSDGDEYAEAAAKHIAASRPENVLALIARIRELERELEQAQRWVPVEEKLPEPGIVVLGWWVNQGPMMAVWDGLHWGDADDHIAIGYGISHWKPVTPP